MANKDFTALGVQILLTIPGIFPAGLNIHEFITDDGSNFYEMDSTPTTKILGNSSTGDILSYKILATQMITFNIIPRGKAEDSFSSENMPFNTISRLLREFHDSEVATVISEGKISVSTSKNVNIIITLPNGDVKTIKDAIYMPYEKGNPFPVIVDGHIDIIKFTFAYSSGKERHY